jgi:hypothetical protein
MNIDAVKEFFAESRDEAISMAATHYGVGRAELEVRELPAAAGISGLGDRSCFLIWIAGQEHAEPRREAREGGGDRGGDGRRRDRARGDRGERGGRGGRGRGDRDRGRGGDRDRGRDRGGDRGGRRAEGPGDRRGDRPEGVDEVRLETLAREAAERVRRSGEPEILESMTAKERWVVHNFLKDIEGVTSASEGEGASKRVKILPE